MSRNSGLIWDFYFLTGSFSIGKGIDQFADPSAWLEIGPDGTNKGMIIPRVLNTFSILSPKAGLTVFDKSDGKIKYFDGVTWQQTGAVQSVNNVFPDNNGNIQLIPSDIGAEDIENKGQLLL